jgi:hypothetical protein
MGGKLFNAPRISNDDYHSLIEFFSNEFKSIGIDTLVPYSFKSKDSHGDLDIIVEGPVIPKEKLMEMFKLDKDQVSQNSSVISIYYQGKYQVDLCFHPEESFQSAHDYNRNGDCGNMVGRIAHMMGFKYGHRGLLYPVRLSDCDELGEVLISRDTGAIHRFFDLDHDDWIEGFDNEMDLYHWVIRSKYFNPEMFKFENLNHINRVRNKKRPVYAGFVEFLETSLPSLYPDRVYIEPSGNKAEYLWKAVLEFNTDTLETINNMIYHARRVKRTHDTFNGNHVREATGLEGGELGKIIKAFENSVRKDFELPEGKDAWVGHVLQYSHFGMMYRFKNWYRQYQNNV